MSFHTDYNQWLTMASKDNCPVCLQQPMPEGMVDVAELSGSWLNAEPNECLKGACHLTAKRHVVELYELDDESLLAFMKEVCLCAKVLQEVTKAVKINYEIHGNSLPHLHVHLYPRYQDDPFPGQPIDYRKKRHDLYAEGEFQGFVARMREGLAISVSER